MKNIFRTQKQSASASGYKSVFALGCALALVWMIAQAQQIWGIAQVQQIWEIAQVEQIWGIAQAQQIWGIAQVQQIWEIAQVEQIWEIAQAQQIWGMVQVQQKLPPDYEKKREAIRNFEFGVVPLYVLGDLNEDGVVDQEDLKLLRAYVTQKSAAGISCMAAADLDEGRSVDARDMEILEQILKPGKVAAPALSSRSRLGCNYKNFFIAARPQAPAGGTVPIHFLDPRFNAQNSSVTVSSGQATVSREGNVFIVHVPASAPGNSTVTVAITLPGPRKYLYTFRIPPAPPSR
jgi:hypothetical protein